MQFLLGTDELGRDLLSRLIQGSRLSLLIGLSSVVMSLIPGILLGLFAGFFPKMIGQRFFGYKLDAPFIDIGTPERFAWAKDNLDKML